MHINYKFIAVTIATILSTILAYFWQRLSTQHKIEQAFYAERRVTFGSSIVQQDGSVLVTPGTEGDEFGKPI